MGEAKNIYFTCLKKKSLSLKARKTIKQKNMATAEFKEVLPKAGLLHHEATYNFVLCKPKIMPLKSITLEKLEKMQKEAQELVRDQDGPQGDPRLEDFMPRKAGDGSSDADGSQRPVPSAPPAEYPVPGAGPLG